MKHERFSKAAQLYGFEPGEVVLGLSADPLSDTAAAFIYEVDDERLCDRVPLRSDESEPTIGSVGRPLTFGADLKLAAGAYPIKLAHPFNPMMAVHASNVAPLLHQITLAYESILPRRPMRDLLIDGSPKEVDAHKSKPAQITRRNSARTTEHE
jgi:hypothetical protein